MKSLRCVGAAILLAGCTLLTSPGEANVPYARQYYGGWNAHPTKNYHYRAYYYKPRANYVGYKHHYVIYTPAQPRYLYYYNPYRKVYWGRCPIDAQGKEAYAHLAEKDQRGTLEEIAETAFPEMGPLPRVPESEEQENIRMDLPPDDLPPAPLLKKSL